MVLTLSIANAVAISVFSYYIKLAALRIQHITPLCPCTLKIQPVLVTGSPSWLVLKGWPYANASVLNPPPTWKTKGGA